MVGDHNISLDPGGPRPLRHIIFGIMNLGCGFNFIYTHISYNLINKLHSLSLSLRYMSPHQVLVHILTELLLLYLGQQLGVVREFRVEFVLQRVVDLLEEVLDDVVSERILREGQE